MSGKQGEGGGAFRGGVFRRIRRVNYYVIISGFLEKKSAEFFNLQFIFLALGKRKLYYCITVIITN